MEYLALSYPGDSVIQLIEPRISQADLSDGSGNRGECASSEERMNLFAGDGKKIAPLKKTDGLPTLKPLNYSRIYVIHAGDRGLLPGPFYEARLAYSQAQMLNEAEIKPYLDIWV
ncbi:MAG: hypothetical protein WCX84_06295 [Syntrophales bacterium]|jgi:hypothetical protein|nr:hypothetical protein [Syntrophales bacterium]